MPVSRNTRPTISGSSGGRVAGAHVDAHRQRRTLAEPARHRHACSHASRKVHAPICRIRALSSAIGMNSPGGRALAPGAPTARAPRPTAGSRRRARRSADSGAALSGLDRVAELPLDRDALERAITNRLVEDLPAPGAALLRPVHGDVRVAHQTVRSRSAPLATTMPMLAVTRCSRRSTTNGPSSASWMRSATRTPLPSKRGPRRARRTRRRRTAPA